MGTTERLCNLMWEWSQFPWTEVEARGEQGRLAACPVDAAGMGQDCDRGGQSCRDTGPSAWGRVPAQRGRQSPRAVRTHTWIQGPGWGRKPGMAEFHSLPERSPKPLKPGCVDLLAIFPDRHLFNTCWTNSTIVQATMEAYQEQETHFIISVVCVRGPGLTVLWRTHKTWHWVVILVMIYCSKRVKHKLIKGKRQRGEVWSQLGACMPLPLESHGTSFVLQHWLVTARWSLVYQGRSLETQHDGFYWAPSPSHVSKFHFQKENRW